jgi:hypothetical protein
MARLMPERVEGALKAVEKVLAGAVGNDVPFEWAADLRAVEELLGLKRPLASYAPRTRRRYVSAARKGDRGAQKTLAKERVGRSTRVKAQYGITPAQLTKLNKVRLPIIASKVDIAPFLDDEVIKDIVKMYGFKYLMEVLTQQLDSIKRYTEGNREPGRNRWLNRGELEEQAKDRLGAAFQLSVYYINGTDPYYYYHGHLK